MTATASEFFDSLTQSSHPNHHEPSPAISLRCKHKTDKYTPLVHLCHLQHTRRRRTNKPRFVPAITTYAGEICPNTRTLLDWLASHVYARTAKEIDKRFDLSGVTPKQAASAFRSELLDELASANAYGVGLMLMTAGFPLPRRGSYFADA